MTLVALLTGLTLQTRSPQVAHTVALSCNGLVTGHLDAGAHLYPRPFLFLRVPHQMVHV